MPMEMSVENVINQIYDLVLNSVPHVLDYAMNFTSGLFSLIIGIIISRSICSWARNGSWPSPAR